jgi:hypothetical protein
MTWVKARPPHAELEGLGCRSPLEPPRSWIARKARSGYSSMVSGAWARWRARMEHVEVAHARCSNALILVFSAA